MIIRETMNAQYTHDREALLAWTLGMREFSGLAEAEVSVWLDELEPHPLCAKYQAIRDIGCDYIHFWPINQFVDCLAEDRARMFHVMLWKPQATALELIKGHGFTCIICRFRTPWEERTAYRGNELVRKMVRDRQEVCGPDLVCERCVLDLNWLLGCAAYGASMNKPLRNFMRRVEPAIGIDA